MTKQQIQKEFEQNFLDGGSVDDCGDVTFTARGALDIAEHFYHANVAVDLNTQQCLEVAQLVYDGYIKAMKPPVFAIYSFPDWLTRQLLKQRNA